MVHSGYEATSVDDAFGSFRGLWRMTRAVLFNRGYQDPKADETLKDWQSSSHAGTPVTLTLNGVKSNGAASPRERETVEA
jgi:hypothetical protein